MTEVAEAKKPVTGPVKTLFSRIGKSPEVSSGVQAPRKYFEVFGDTLAELRFFKTLTICLTALAIYLTVVVANLAKRPPLVIRVDEVGRAEAVKDYRAAAGVSAPEISNFTQHFLQYFTAWNAYTFDEDFERAFRMMTRECQQKMNDYLASNRIPDQIKNGQLKVKLNITEIAVEKDTPEFVSLKVRGNRLVESYRPDEPAREVVFEDRLMLSKVRRTESAPWGLLVNEWAESLFKNQ